MVEQGRGGRIVNVTSVHEHVPLPDGAAYVTAKHALGGLTKQMAFELGEHGILVNSVAPGEIATKMTGQEDEDPRGNERPVPVGRPGDAREVGALIAFLASPENGYVTGQSYVIDGGMLVTRLRPAEPASRSRGRHRSTSSRGRPPCRTARARAAAWSAAARRSTRAGARAPSRRR